MPALSNRNCNKPRVVLIVGVASNTPADLLSELAQSVDITLARKGSDGSMLGLVVMFRTIIHSTY